MYFVWFTANANILTYGQLDFFSLEWFQNLSRFSSATVGPVFFGLGMRDAMLMVIGVDIM